MNSQEYDLSSSHNHDNRYPVVTTERTTITENDYYSNYAYIINLGNCKIVTLSIQRKTNLDLTTSWTDITTLGINIRPSTNYNTSDLQHNVTVEVTSGGVVRARATSSKSTVFTGKMTYVVF